MANPVRVVGRCDLVDTAGERNPTQHEMMQALETTLRTLKYNASGEDHDYVSSLPPDQMKQVLDRLAGFVQLRGGGSIKDASKVAGVSVPTMYRLRSVWENEERRTLKALVGSAARAPRGAGRSKELNAARKIAVALLEKAEAEALTTNAFARMVRDASFESISINGAETIVREVRREHRRTAAVLDASYGKSVIADAVGVSLVIEEPATEPSMDAKRYIAVMSLVMEAVSGLILAYEIGPEDQAAKAQETAFKAAYKFLSVERADVQRERPSELHVTVGPEKDPWHRVLQLQLQNWPVASIRAQGPRRFGRGTLDVLGTSLGRIQFLPASTENGSPDAAKIRAIGQTPVSLHHARAIVARIVAEHNESVLALLRDAGTLPDPQSSFVPGAMSAALAFTQPRKAVRETAWG